jgi:hypothetical protein
MMHSFGLVWESKGLTRWICIFIGLCLWCNPLVAQQRYKGIVQSSEGQLPIQGATIQVLQNQIGTSSDSAGSFSFLVDLPQFTVQIKALGHETLEFTWDGSDTSTRRIELEKTYQLLDEIDLRTKGRYRNRDNPAVALIRQVIDHRRLHRLQRYDHIQYKGYEKINLSIRGGTEGFKTNFLTKGYRFFFENVDTTALKGQQLLPFYLEERMTQHYQQSFPFSHKTWIEAQKKTEFDQRFINNDNLQTYFKYLQNDIDLYDNTLLLVNRPFTSPIADAGPTFYKYYLRDTITENHKRYVRIDFMPRNPEDKLLNGTLEIAIDEQYAVRNAVLHVDQKVNINWLDAMEITLRYEAREGLGYFPVYNETKMSFGVLGSDQGILAWRTRTFENFDTTTPIQPSQLAGIPIEPRPTARTFSDQEWARIRPLSLRDSEQKTYINIDSLRHNTAFRRTIEWGSIFMTSFKNMGPLEWGPIEYTYSFNKLEGNRFRLSARTTRQWSEQFYGEAYVAYGTKDQRWKYFGSAAYTLNKERIGVFPAHYVQLVYHEDAREPGERMDFMNGDSFIRSFRTSRQDHWLYQQIYKINHVIEWGNHFMLQSSFTKWTQSPEGQLQFLKSSDFSALPQLQTTELGLDLRWAPHETYFQRNLMRSPIINEHPIFALRYKAGLKGVLDGEYAYHNLRFDVFKRIMLSQLGYTDANIGLGYIHGAVPYPLLHIPMTNQSYLLAPDAYLLMNNLEFVSDQYVKFSLDHQFHGFFLNKIPGIRYFKLRESVGFNYLYGSLRKENTPHSSSQHTFLLPTIDGALSTFTLERKPYMEGSVGLDNIFKVLRVEYVRRFSYLDHPNIKKQGWRFRIKVDF